MGESIVLPADLETGENLLLSSKFSKYKESNPKAIVWIVEPEDRAQKTVVMDGGKIISIPTGKIPGEIKVTLVVSYLDEIKFTSHSFKVIGDGPNPKPEPFVNPIKPINPDSPVNPVNPDNPIAGFTKEIKSFPISKDITVEDTVKIGGVFLSNSSRVSSGEIINSKELMESTVKGITDSCGLNVTIAFSPWVDSLIEALKKENIKSFKDHSIYWKAVGSYLSKEIK